MRRFTTTALVLGIAALFAIPFLTGTGFAQGWGSGMHGGQGYGHGPGMMGPGHMNAQSHMGSGHMHEGRHMRGSGWMGNRANISEEHRLSADQREQLQELRINFLKNTVDLRTKLQTARLEYQQALKNAETSTNELKKLQNRVAELRSELANRRLDSRDQMKNILSEEQLQYYGQNRHFLMGKGMHGAMGAGTCWKFTDGNN